MVSVVCERDLDLSAETIWQEIRHFDRVLEWVPRGDESSIIVTGEGVGAVRDITLATQGYVQHRLIAFDSDRRMFSYELTAGKPIGMQAYTVVATVSAIGSDRCTIRWAGEMTADDSLDDVETGQALKVALGNMTTGIVAKIKGEVPEFVGQPNEDWQIQHAEK